MFRLVAFTIMMTATSYSEEVDALKSYLWKNLLIIIAASDQEVIDETTKQISAMKDEVMDRDLVIIDASKKPIKQSNFKHPPRDRIAGIREFASIKSDNPSSFVLVGKDGTIKARQSGSLDLNKFFALIDTMPMRKREMRER